MERTRISATVSSNAGATTLEGTIERRDDGSRCFTGKASGCGGSFTLHAPAGSDHFEGSLNDENGQLRTMRATLSATGSGTFNVPEVCEFHGGYDSGWLDFYRYDIVSKVNGKHGTFQIQSRERLSPYVIWNPETEEYEGICY
jgi:hypothetical protein